MLLLELLLELALVTVMLTLTPFGLYHLLAVDPLMLPVHAEFAELFAVTVHVTTHDVVFAAGDIVAVDPLKVPAAHPLVAVGLDNE